MDDQTPRPFGLPLAAPRADEDSPTPPSPPAPAPAGVPLAPPPVTQRGLPVVEPAERQRGRAETPETDPPSAPGTAYTEVPKVAPRVRPTAPLGTTPGVASTPPVAVPPPTPLPVQRPTIVREQPAEEPQERPVLLDDLLIHVLQVGASDLHLTAGAPPTVRVQGELQAVEGQPRLKPETIRQTLYAVMTERQRKTFEEELELDFAYAVPGHARFRVNVFQQRDAVGAVMRMIPWDIKPLDELGMPPVVETFAELKRGLVLVTGPTGSGKSTTLAAIIDLINRSRHDHIMTIEDPVEFLHQHRGCLVNQREVGTDTHGFQKALRHVLRQDPDVILVGEMRDLDTISVALTAAETGHLVFATLHTQSAQDTITRVVDVFPADRQQQVRTQLAATLQGVLCQTLLRTADGHGRAAGVEVMVCTPAIRAMIRDDKLQQIQGALQSGAKFGMQTLNAHLAELVRAGRVSYGTALEACTDRLDFDTLVGSTSARQVTGWDPGARR